MMRLKNSIKICDYNIIINQDQISLLSSLLQFCSVFCAELFVISRFEQGSTLRFFG